MTLLIYSQEQGENGLQITTQERQKIQACLPLLEIIISAHPTQEELQRTEILLSLLSLSKLDFSLLPSLKWIHVTSAGIDSIPDEVKKLPIIITNSSGVHPNPISEHIFAYLLMFARGMKPLILAQQEKHWDRENVHPFEIHGKTIGIVGLGRIGLETARLASTFQMKVHAFVRDLSAYSSFDYTFYETKDMDTYLEQSDFVINCLPGTEETRGLFTLEKFQKMRPTAYFINIGRGSTVVEEDLIKALQDKIIAGAGLDVFEEEPLPADSPLWSMENVIITPHVAGKTPEYMNRVIDIFCTNLKAYVQQQKMPNEVDKEKGY